MAYRVHALVQTFSLPPDCQSMHASRPLIGPHVVGPCCLSLANLPMTTLLSVSFLAVGGQSGDVRPVRGVQ